MINPSLQPKSFMRIACSTDSFRGYPLEDAFAAVASAGLRGVELVPFSAEPGASALPEEAVVGGWRSALDRHELEICAIQLAEGDLVDPETPEKALPLLEVGHRLGAELGVIRAGDPFTDDQIERTLDAARRLGDRAGELGMRVALRTEPGLLGDSRSMMETLIKIDHPAVRLDFDAAAYSSINEFSSAEVALQRVYPYVASLRLRDSDGVPGSRNFPCFGEGGAIDFARLLQIISPLEYSGPAIIDIAPQTRRPRTLPQCAEDLVESVKLLRDCGWFDRL